MVVALAVGLTAPCFAASDYWAFQPIASPAVPQSAAPWVKTSIDAFVLAALEKNGLSPSPALDKRSLVRRLYLDLLGLPPSPEEADAFVADSDPRAYENLVDRLLDSPHYGERWALRWLDVVRYADTNGFELDAYRTDAWRYRDYVVRSFNADKPFNRFVEEQVAGDELFPGDADALIATGFNGAGPRHVVGGNQDKEEARQEVLTEMTLGIGQVFLGLTVQCARCHDHKFDPIKQADYYRLQSFFAATDIAERNLAPTDEIVAYEAALKAYEKRLEPLEAQLEQIERPYREQAEAIKREKVAPELLAALAIPKARRSEDQKRLAEDAGDQLKAAWYEVVELIPDDVKAQRQALRNRMHAIELEKPDPPRAAYAVKNMDEAPTTRILKVGDYRHPLDPVEPEFLSALSDYGVDPPEGPKMRRAALARWLTSESNPLTARVMANRIWQFRMGRGLAPDPNNFGLLGGGVSHPELLDHLASRFVEMGWSVKALDRMIVLSSAYRQSAEIDPAKAEKDPDNKLYWRADRRRLEAEVIRDSALAVAGRLNLEIGGKPVLIPIDRSIYDLIFSESEPDNLWPVTPDEAQHRRRSLYLLNRRTVRLPLLANFDQPDTMTSCAARSTSTHALQALTLLNGEFMQQQSTAFADRVAAVCGSDKSCQARQAYLFALAREPNNKEAQLAVAFLADDETRLSDFCLALLNRNEFVYRP